MPEDILWINYSQRFRTFPSLITKGINPETKVIICIPVLAEPELTNTLESLLECHNSGIHTEVILLFNRNIFLSEDEVSLHQQQWNVCLDWIEEHPHSFIDFIPVYVENLPDPKGGVGWARKLVMDEAARRLNEKGLIVCLDADCKVLSNYIEEIVKQFENHPEFNAASIYFEHRLDDLTQEVRESIILYELHLRYLVHAQRWCGHPFAYHTVGSSMAVRRNEYLKQGGMNTRRAGEDFYFLQKFIETESLFEIKSTTVYPSPRISNRVPFGTGKAMMKMIEDRKQWWSPNFESLKRIKPLFDNLDLLREQLKEEAKRSIELIIPEVSNELVQFLEEINFLSEVREIAAHTNSSVSFKKRFFRFFNAFMMIRYMHYMRDHFFPDVEVVEACRKLLEASNVEDIAEKDEDYLLLFRKMDRT